MPAGKDIDTNVCTLQRHVSLLRHLPEHTSTQFGFVSARVPPAVGFALALFYQLKHGLNTHLI
jgi:hypothetical protein